MSEEFSVYATPNRATPGRPVVFDPKICDGCNRCVTVCLEDILIPNPVKGRPPVVLHPEECKTRCMSRFKLDEHVNIAMGTKIAAQNRPK